MWDKWENDDERSSKTVFFNQGSVEPGGSSNYLVGSLKILQIVPFWVMVINIPEVSRVKTGWETLL